MAVKQIRITEKLYPIKAKIAPLAALASEEKEAPRAHGIVCNANLPPPLPRPENLSDFAKIFFSNRGTYGILFTVCIYFVNGTIARGLLPFPVPETTPIGGREANEGK